MSAKDKRDEVYDFILEYKTKHEGNSPSFSEIAEGCNLNSTSLVNYYLDQLEIDGRIKRDGVKSIYVGGKFTKE